MNLINCDTCYVQVRPDMVWTHTIQPFVIPAANGLGEWRDEDGYWAACEDCHALIETKDIEGLMKRSFVLDPLSEKVPAARMMKETLLTHLLNAEPLLHPYRGHLRIYPLDGQHRGGSV